MAEVKYLNEWLELAKTGNFEEAQQLYFDKLLPVIADAFSVKYSKLLEEDELLISILGFSPEPIILTANHHFVLKLPTSYLLSHHKLPPQTCKTDFQGIRFKCFIIYF